MLFSQSFGSLMKESLLFQSFGVVRSYLKGSQKSFELSDGCNTLLVFPHVAELVI